MKGKKRNDTGKQIQLITYHLNNPVWYIQVWRGEWIKIILVSDYEWQLTSYSVHIQWLRGIVSKFTLYWVDYWHIQA